jgi:hypothetical protein
MSGEEETDAPADAPALSTETGGGPAQAERRGTLRPALGSAPDKRRAWPASRLLLAILDAPAVFLIKLGDKTWK